MDHAKPSLKCSDALFHENILPVQSIRLFECDDSFQGCSLAEISEGGAVSEGHTAAIIRQALCALVHLHSYTIAHGNVCGANLYIEASTGLVKLITELRACNCVHYSDCLGISSDAGARLYSAECCDIDSVPACRRPMFMAPELRAGACQLSAAGDVWALGCAATALLAGGHACADQDWRIVGCSSSACLRPPAPPCLSLAAAAFLADCLCTDAADRPSCRELLDHPFVQLPSHEDSGDSDDAWGLAAQLDDVLVIPDTARNRPPPSRPPQIPALRAPVPYVAGSLFFSSPSQTVRLAAEGAGAAAAECCPLLQPMCSSAAAATSGGSTAPLRKRKASAAGRRQRGHRRRSIDLSLPLPLPPQPAALAA
jgi:serine/threonine protein kinase